MNEILKLIKGNMRKNGMIIALALIVVIFQVWTKGVLLRPLNITNLILQNGYILILAIGMLPVIITGRIDLSVGSIVAFTGALAAIMMVEVQVPFVITLIICLAVGAAIGAWHGMWTAYVGIPAFITTLSGTLVFRGLTIALLRGKSIGPFNSTFRAISTNFIPDFFGGVSLNMTAVLIGILICLFIILKELRSRNSDLKAGLQVVPLWFFITKTALMCLGVLLLIYFLAAYNGIPYLLVLLVFLIVFYTFVTTNTVLGRRVYAIGGNEAAARLSGINTKGMIFLTNINVSILAAVAGIVFAARLNAGTPRAGNGFELDAIAACFIGGASVTGGSGTIAGAVIGTLIMGVMNNGMSIVGISVDIQQAIKGLVILLAVAIDMLMKKRR
ncbi:MAG: multiple monosaccharide ABC transporter permease [Sphaerochaetaceae bacterium]|nr:sugar ABC transporter permease [Sphaerochaetaceae bacterium]MDX9809342.1 sugar ABC transporter permease [Sphaerochaetaceae bacterium]